MAYGFSVKIQGSGGVDIFDALSLKTNSLQWNWPSWNTAYYLHDSTSILYGTRFAGDEPLSVTLEITNFSPIPYTWNYRIEMFPSGFDIMGYNADADDYTIPIGSIVHDFDLVESQYYQDQDSNPGYPQYVTAPILMLSGQTIERTVTYYPPVVSLNGDQYRGSLFGPLSVHYMGGREPSNPNVSVEWFRNPTGSTSLISLDNFWEWDAGHPTMQNLSGKAIITYEEAIGGHFSLNIYAPGDNADIQYYYLTDENDLDSKVYFGPTIGWGPSIEAGTSQVIYWEIDPDVVGDWGDDRFVLELGLMLDTWFNNYYYPGPRRIIKTAPRVEDTVPGVSVDVFSVTNHGFYYRNNPQDQSYYNSVQPFQVDPTPFSGPINTYDLESLEYKFEISTSPYWTLRPGITSVKALIGYAPLPRLNDMMQTCNGSPLSPTWYGSMNFPYHVKTLPLLPDTSQEFHFRNLYYFDNRLYEWQGIYYNQYMTGQQPSSWAQRWGDQYVDPAPSWSEAAITEYSSGRKNVHVDGEITANGMKIPVVVIYDGGKRVDWNASTELEVADSSVQVNGIEVEVSPVIENGSYVESAEYPESVMWYKTSGNTPYGWISSSPVTVSQTFTNTGGISAAVGNISGGSYYYYGDYETDSPLVPMLRGYRTHSWQDWDEWTDFLDQQWQILSRTIPSGGGTATARWNAAAGVYRFGGTSGTIMEHPCSYGYAAKPELGYPFLTSRQSRIPLWHLQPLGVSLNVAVSAILYGEYNNDYKKSKEVVVTPSVGGWFGWLTSATWTLTTPEGNMIAYADALLDNTAGTAGYNSEDETGIQVIGIQPYGNHTSVDGWFNPGDIHYGMPGRKRHTITFTVTDALGRTASASEDIIFPSLGGWKVGVIQ